MDTVSAKVDGSGEAMNSMESGHLDGDVKRAPDGKVTTRLLDCVGPCSYGSRGVEWDAHTTPPDGEVHDKPCSSKEESVPAEVDENKDKDEDKILDKDLDKKKEDKDKFAVFPKPDPENCKDWTTCSIVNLLLPGDVASVLKGDKSHHRVVPEKGPDPREYDPKEKLIKPSSKNAG